MSGARITVWYEEEHGGRKMDVPYVGVVNSCDPREGLYVKFDGWRVAAADPGPRPPAALHTRRSALTPGRSRAGPKRC